MRADRALYQYYAWYPTTPLPTAAPHNLSTYPLSSTAAAHYTLSAQSVCPLTSNPLQLIVGSMSVQQQLEDVAAAAQGGDDAPQQLQVVVRLVLQLL